MEEFRPLDVVVKEFLADKSQERYEELLFSLLMTAKNDGSILLPLESDKEIKQEEFYYPRVKAGDGNYYYALCTESATLPEKLKATPTPLDACLEYMLNDKMVNGACLNPWDGGIFIPSQYLITLLTGSTEE